MLEYVVIIAIVIAAALWLFRWIAATAKGEKGCACGGGPARKNCGGCPRRSGAGKEL